MATDPEPTGAARWRAIPGFPGYEITPDGDVRSWWGSGAAQFAARPHRVTPEVDAKRARLRVAMTDGVYTRRRDLAVLVLLTWGPKPSSQKRTHSIVFKDGDRFNVRLSNLAWRPRSAS